MKTRALLQALLDSSGDNPNSLAKKLNGAATQPQIFKFLRGQVAEPKRRTLQPVADFYGINVEAFFSEDQAGHLLDQLSAGEVQVGKRGGITQKNTSTQERPSAAELTPMLQDWRLQASQKSKEVIDQLTLLAQKNALGEDDWLLIEQMIQRFMKR